jgi:hypothetical protein
VNEDSDSTQQLTANVLSKLRREPIDLTKRANDIQKLLNAYLIKKADILQVGQRSGHNLINGFSDDRRPIGTCRVETAQEDQ